LINVTVMKTHFTWNALLHHLVNVKDLKNASYLHSIHNKLLHIFQFLLADRTNGRAIGTLLRPSSVCLSSSVTLCIVAKRCVLEQKLLLRAYKKSYMRNRLVPKWMTLIFV